VAKTESEEESCDSLCKSVVSGFVVDFLFSIFPSTACGCSGSPTIFDFRVLF